VDLGLSSRDALVVHRVDTIKAMYFAVQSSMTPLAAPLDHQRQLV
jgi:hypothetical protein